MKKALFLALALASAPALAYDANGVELGGTEAQVKARFPSIRCKPLEWKSDAADRRCDDAKIPFAGGVQARITFYLKNDAIQAFDLRFDMKDLERVSAFLKTRYGKPLAEATEVISRPEKEDRKVYKARWEKGTDKAVLSAQLETKTATLEVQRGTFETEIYRVR